MRNAPMGRANSRIRSRSRTAARTWIFDLDNTLHDAGTHIFPFLHRSMTEYIQTHLGLDEAGAWELRRRYWLRYGATLRGLIKHHAVDPHHFLWHTHQLPDLASMVSSSSGLHAALRRLPGRKLVFSNAPSHYVMQVLTQLGIKQLFDGIFSIEHTRFLPKPHPYGFYRLLAKARVDPRRCIFVEDSPENLRTAKKLGMTTVWVHAKCKCPSFVDLRVTSVLELPRRLGTLCPQHAIRDLLHPR